MLEANLDMGHVGDASRWREKEERRVNMLNEKGLWEGGVILNTCSDTRSLASFHLQLIVNLKP